MNWILVGLIAFIVIGLIAFRLRNQAARKTPEQAPKSETKPDTTAPLKRTKKQ